ncbi:hypothetical protein D9M72_490160 [compost metagenome]
MAAELVANLQRPLEVDPRALCPARNRRQPQRFFPGLDLEPALVAAGFRQGGHRQTHTGMGDGGAHVDGLRIIARGNTQLDAFLERGDGIDGADVGNNACEHQFSLSYSSNRSSP